MTPPFNLVVARPRSGDALELLARELYRRGVAIPGVTGALPEADAFATAWQRAAGVRREARMRQGIYKVGAARLPAGVAGSMRHAIEADRPLLVEWLGAFEDEALPETLPRLGNEAIVDRRLASDSAGFALWVDGEPVSLAGFGGKTPTGFRIGPVYTPPGLRRRGYASALVARLSEQLLNGGADYCFLYTDLANPTSNRIYESVGYELVAESADYVFAAGSGASSPDVARS